MFNNRSLDVLSTEYNRKFNSLKERAKFRFARKNIRLLYSNYKHCYKKLKSTNFTGDKNDLLLSKKNYINSITCLEQYLNSKIQKNDFADKKITKSNHRILRLKRKLPEKDINFPSNEMEYIIYKNIGDNYVLKNFILLENSFNEYRLNKTMNNYSKISKYLITYNNDINELKTISMNKYNNMLKDFKNQDINIDEYFSYKKQEYNENIINFNNRKINETNLDKIKNFTLTKQKLKLKTLYDIDIDEALLIRTKILPLVNDIEYNHLKMDNNKFKILPFENIVNIAKSNLTDDESLVERIIPEYSESLSKKTILQILKDKDLHINYKNTINVVKPKIVSKSSKIIVKSE
jgi:hypothetical protein